MKFLLQCSLMGWLLCSVAYAGDPISDVKAKFDSQGNGVHFAQRSDLYGDILLRFNNFVLETPERQENFYASMKAAGERAQIHELHMLHYGEAGIAKGGMSFLEVMPELRLLSLGGARYDDSDLAYLKHCAKLQRLYVSGPVGKVALEGIANAQSLELIRAQRVKAEWEHFPRLPNLILLDAEHSNLNDAGAKSLQSCEKLRVIYAYSTDLSDEGLAELAKIKSLEFLGVECPNITQTGIEKFQQARPDVEFLSKKPQPEPRAPRRGNGGGSLAMLDR